MCFGLLFTWQRHFGGLKMQTFKNDTIIAYKKLIFENGDVIHMHIMCSQSVALPNDTANYWPGIRNAAFKSFLQIILTLSSVREKLKSILLSCKLTVNIVSHVHIRQDCFHANSEPDCCLPFSRCCSLLRIQIRETVFILTKLTNIWHTTRPDLLHNHSWKCLKIEFLKA